MLYLVNDGRMFFDPFFRPDHVTNRKLARLRMQRSEGRIGETTSISSNISLHADPNLDIGGQFLSQKGELLTLNADYGAQGEWAGLHIQIPAKDLSSHLSVGFSLRGRAPDYTILTPCFRSGTESGFVDSFFDKHILLHGDEDSHVDALEIHDREDVPLHAPWRQLVLFLPTVDFKLTLSDLRVFLA